MTAPWLSPPRGAMADQAAEIAQAIQGLETPRLRLRPAQRADDSVYAAIFLDPRGPNDRPPDGPKAAWADDCETVASWLLRGAGLYAIDDKSTGQRLGDIPLTREWGDPGMERGWCVTAAAKGQGIATEAALSDDVDVLRHCGGGRA